MMNIHRILSGAPEHRKELIAAGLFVLIWFAMDVIQFADWAWQKYNQPRAIPCEPIAGSTLCVSPAIVQFPGYYCGSHDCSIPLTQNNAGKQ